MYLEGLGRLTICITLNCAEDDVLVTVASGCGLKNRLEAKAGRASRRPEVDYDTWVLPNDLLQLHKRVDLADLAKDGI